MLLWQQNMHDFYDLFYLEIRWDIARKAIFYAILIYGLLVLPLILVKGGQELIVFPIVIRSDAVPVLFMGQQRASGGQKSGSDKRMSLAPTQKATVSHKQKKKVIEKKKIKNAVKKEKKVIEKISEKIKPKLETKPLKKELKKTALKKIEVPKKALKKNEPKKQEEPKKAEIVPEKELKKHEPIKKEQEKIVEKVLEIKTEPVKETGEEIFIGASDENFEPGFYDVQTKTHMALSMAIIRAWKPPRVKVQQPSIVVVELDMQGKPVNVELQQKSGVLVHDIESRAAALRAEYPQDSWGKKFTISFGD